MHAPRASHYAHYSMRYSARYEMPRDIRWRDSVMRCCAAVMLLRVMSDDAY